MATHPRQDSSEKLPRAPPNKNLFHWNCDGDSDDEELPALNNFHRSTHQPAPEKSIIDDVLETAMAESHDADTGARETQKNEESNELFVSDDEEQPERTPPPQNDIKIKSEPDEDDLCIIIDSVQASSGAQEKWTKPLKFTIDLTGDNQDATETKKIIKAEPVTVKIEQEDGGTSISQHQASQQSCLVSDAYTSMNKRMTELKAKATTGSLSDAEFEELLQITRQLQDAKHATERCIVSEGQSLSGDNNRPSGSQPKKGARQPAKTLAQRWAEREEKDQRKEANRKRKRCADEVRASSAKKVKQNVDPDDNSDDDDAGEVAASDGQSEVRRQIAELLKPLDFVLQREQLGELPPEPEINTRNKAEQLRLMEMAAKRPEEFDEAHLKRQLKELQVATSAASWGPRIVYAINGKWEPRGVLQTPLLSHQITVGAWLLGRELKNTPKFPRGGMLADGMGLGKTIEALSCIARNQASEKLRVKGEVATIVVCPSQHVIGVWIDQIKEHCKPEFSRSVVQYKRQNKMDTTFLGSLNIVLATYHQVRASVPSAKVREQMNKELADPEKYKEWLDEHTGDLHRTKWYRVVLDEAHEIKNHLTHGALSCFELKSKYRWVLSGTPLINSETEFFPYFKFLRCHKINDFADYLRKYHSGYLQLSDEETIIFNMMEQCFRDEINNDLENEQAHKKMRSYLTMLLRLRQAATHPFLLEGMMRDYFSLDNIRAVREQLAELKGKRTVYEQIGTWTQRHDIPDERMRVVIAEAEGRLEEDSQFTRYYRKFEADDTEPGRDDKAQIGSSAANSSAKKYTMGGPIVIDEDSDEVNSQDEASEDSDGMVPEEFLNEKPASHGKRAKHVATIPESSEESYLDPFGRSQFGLHFDMDSHLEYLENVRRLDSARCGICRLKPQMPLQGKGNKYPKCRTVIGAPKSLEPFSSDDNDDADARLGQKRKGDKVYSFGFDSNGFQHYDDDRKNNKPSRFLQISDQMADGLVAPSGKMAALKETVLRWQTEAPEDKIIIFSQFNTVMKTVGRMLEAEGITFNYLSGKQTTEQREKSVKDFQEGADVKVLIISLRAGGQCLTLTRANRVVLMELWWNHALEQQAFSRVYRIGQIKETHFVRFIVKTPIEQRMLKIQVDKILQIDAALQDGGVRAAKITLTFEDLASLLGKVIKENGEVVRIARDNPDDDEGHDDESTSVDGSDDEEVESLPGFVVPDDVIELDDSDEDSDEDTGGLDSDDE
ncbi:SNF2 family domain-containing protein [Colletotrichum sojae]|uniref:SNF2 family domain-containing protein n=1 Tax=Colletotrichum sojae TaxID=2175907 RepID=A0A8H6JPI3_9PEZI|nr:SNF2 family domain-containing protein [Colletotrichum sojae]